MDMVLVLEDEPAVQEVFRAVLRRNGFNFEVAATAEDALALCKHHRGAIALLIADVHLPSSRSGTDAALEVRRSYPHVPILFTSGTPMEFWDEADRQNAEQIPQGCVCFIQKPFTCWTLIERIGDLLPRIELARTA